LSRFHLRVAYLLRDFLHERGAQARLYLGNQTLSAVATGQTTCRELLRDVAAGRLAGVAYVYAPWNISAQALTDAAGVPSVALWGEGYRQRIELDYCGLVRTGARYLWEHGRRRIAVAGWGVENFPGAHRAGLRELLREAGVTVPDEWLRLEFHPNDPGAGWEDFRELWSARAEKPDGLLVLDDVLFSDMRAALVESGARIPADLLVATHGNKGLEVTAPFPVTRLEFDPLEAAAALGELLLAAARREVTEPTVRMVSARVRETAPVETPIVSTMHEV
jgi:DNA-binding LacI/PurR family transcriptional regulator